MTAGLRLRRRMPSLLAVAIYWHQRADIEQVLPRWPGLLIGLGEPFRAACGWLSPVLPLDIATADEGAADFPDIWRRSGRWLERAHLITRATGHAGSGLDVPANVIQLCQLCHQAMPLFDAGEEEQAVDWLPSTPAKDPAWQLFTDTFRWPETCSVSMSRVLLVYQRGA